MDAIPFRHDSDPPVRGFLHRPEGANGPRPVAVVLTHGAGSNCQAPLLVAVAKVFAGAGITVLRCDLPYRQKRPHGPPFPGEAARDRQGLRHAVEAAGAGCDASPRIFLGGHSYGGRQATMLAAEDPAIAAGLLLTSYPLHPPGQPSRLRTEHFPALRVDALFVHGVRDPFASSEEIQQALKLIPARTMLLEVDGAGHDLRLPKRSADAAGEASPLPERILEAFLTFF